MKRIYVVIIIFSACSFSARGQKPDAQEILSCFERSYRTLEDYSATVQAEIDMEHLRVPRMNVTIYFKQPDKIHIESEDFAMLPRDGVGFNPFVYTKNYSGRIEGIDTLDGIQTTKMLLTQKNDTVRSRQLTVWVDLQRCVVVKMESVPYRGRQLKMALEYTKVENTWWLPSKILLTLDVRQSSEQDQSRYDRGEDDTHSQMGRIQLPRKGTITVTYSNYKVNQHLSDELFEKKKVEKKK
ncbi:MAG: hypothetical protein ABSB78_02745 [Bacteroidota bacterium]